MSDAPKEESGKKKGGKLPIILAVVLMVGGGGFFMTKKNGKHEKPKIKEAKEEILLPDEYINNMADGRTYVRVKLGLKTVDGFKAEEVMSHDAEISDAINTILKTTDPKEIVTEKQVKTLKIRICAALNTILENADPEKSKRTSPIKRPIPKKRTQRRRKKRATKLTTAIPAILRKRLRSRSCPQLKICQKDGTPKRARSSRSSSRHWLLSKPYAKTWRITSGFCISPLQNPVIQPN